MLNRWTVVETQHPHQQPAPWSPVQHGGRSCCLTCTVGFQRGLTGETTWRQKDSYCGDIYTNLNSTLCDYVTGLCRNRNDRWDKNDWSHRCHWLTCISPAQVRSHYYLNHLDVWSNIKNSKRIQHLDVLHFQAEIRTEDIAAPAAEWSKQNHSGPSSKADGGGFGPRGASKLWRSLKIKYL